MSKGYHFLKAKILWLLKIDLSLSFFYIFLSLLKKTNKDAVGILEFDDRINYDPIIQAPDHGFYVRRNIEKQYGNAEIPFISAEEILILKL